MDNTENVPNGETPAQEPTPAPETPDTAQENEAPKKRKAKKPKAESAALDSEFLRIDSGSAEFERIVLPKDDTDPHWDPKMGRPVPDALVKGLAEFGWDESHALAAVRSGDNLKIVNGRTRIRAVPKANALRKKAGLPALVVPVHVIEEQDDVEGVIRDLRRGVRLNRHVQEIDPMTLAESIVRALSAGIEEKQVAEDHAVTVNDLHGYLLLTDEDKCPPTVQELLREGKISFTAALELARRADKMTKGEITQAAEQVAKIAGGGLKVTAAQVKKAAGASSDGPATQKQKKQFLLDVQSAQFAGKHGEAVKWAAIVALEVGMGTRTIDSAYEALDKIAKGHTVRVDFKQYQDGAKDGKGQDK